MIDGTKPVEFSFFKTFILSYRWFFNMIIVGLPWLYFSVASFSWNFVMNTIQNNMWAGGNIWLLGNTVFMFLQIVDTWFLMVEWPFYLRHTFALRWVWIIVGIIYSA